MEIKEFQLLNELRGIFFTCLDLESGELQFQNVVLKLLNHLKDSTDAMEISFYRFNAWKEKLVVKCQQINIVVKREWFIGCCRKN